MKVAVIYGSVRSGRQGIKGAKFLVNKLKERGHDASLVDPMEYDLPLLNKMHKEYPSGEAPEKMEAVHKILSEADGFVIVSAEYNHSVPAALKNLLDHFQTEYFYKPSAIACYSVGSFGGSRAAMSLRMILPELGTTSIPTIFHMSKVHESFDEEGNAVDENYNKRVVKFLEEFEWYMEAMKKQRS